MSEVSSSKAVTLLMESGWTVRYGKDSKAVYVAEQGPRSVYGPSPKKITQILKLS